MIQLNAVFWADLEWWWVFVSTRNGISLMRDVGNNHQPLKYGQMHQDRGVEEVWGRTSGFRCNGLSGQFYWGVNGSKGDPSNHTCSSNSHLGSTVPRSLGALPLC